MIRRPPRSTRKESSAASDVYKRQKSESAILIITFLATLFLELEFAIYIGVLLSLVFFLSKTSTPNIPTLSIDTIGSNPSRKLINVMNKPVKQCPQLKIIRIDMSVYFGSINHIQKRIAQIVENEKIYHILIVATGINFIDLAGGEALVDENRRLAKYNGGLYFVGLNSSVYEFAARSCFIKKIGSDHFFDSKTAAISSIYKRLDKSVCSACEARIFRECG
jgi:SulP family sulfate permease